MKCAGYLAAVVYQGPQGLSLNEHEREVLIPSGGISNSHHEAALIIPLVTKE